MIFEATAAYTVCLGTREAFVPTKLKNCNIKICEITALDLSYVVTVKSTAEISQNFVAFSEYMNFI